MLVVVILVEFLRIKRFDSLVTKQRKAAITGREQKIKMNDISAKTRIARKCWDFDSFFSSKLVNKTKINDN